MKIKLTDKQQVTVLDIALDSKIKAVKKVREFLGNKPGLRECLDYVNKLVDEVDDFDWASALGIDDTNLTSKEVDELVKQKIADDDIPGHRG